MADKKNVEATENTVAEDFMNPPVENGAENEQSAEPVVTAPDKPVENVQKKAKKVESSVQKKAKNVAQKLLSIQTNIKAPKNLFNSYGGYNYRNAESILESVKPYLEREGCMLLLVDEILQISDRFYVKANAHFIDTESGDEIVVSACARESAEKKGMDSSQVTGATSSYARKYALNGLFLLDDTKDADTDEYAKTTGSEKKGETVNNGGQQTTNFANKNKNNNGGDEKW